MSVVIDKISPIFYHPVAPTAGCNNSSAYRVAAFIKFFPRKQTSVELPDSETYPAPASVSVPRSTIATGHIECTRAALIDREPIAFDPARDAATVLRDPLSTPNPAHRSTRRTPRIGKNVRPRGRDACPVSAGWNVR